MYSAICRVNRDSIGLERFDYAKGIWETGNWHVAEATARGLIGKRIYLHDAQDNPSRFGGKILEFRVLPPEHPAAGRVVFKVQYDEQSRGFRTSRDVWSQEMKLIE